MSHLFNKKSQSNDKSSTSSSENNQSLFNSFSIITSSFSVEKSPNYNVENIHSMMEGGESFEFSENFPTSTPKTLHNNEQQLRQKNLKFHQLQNSELEIFDNLDEIFLEESAKSNIFISISSRSAKENLNIEDSGIGAFLTENSNLFSPNFGKTPQVVSNRNQRKGLNFLKNRKSDEELEDEISSNESEFEYFSNRDVPTRKGAIEAMRKIRATNLQLEKLAEELGVKINI